MRDRMAESRKLKRQRTDALFCVYDKNDDRFIGYLVDMTVMGVKLRTMAPMETNVIFRFRLDMPAEIGGSAEISFDAESMWCKQCEDSPEYHVGLQLQDVPGEEIERIQQLLDGPLFKEVDAIVHITVGKKTM